MSSPALLVAGDLRCGDDGHAAVIATSRRGNERFLASRSVSAPVPRRPPARAHDVRRLRDLLRAALLGGHFAGGQLPAENELMSGYRATRATVRAALGMLRAEGLVERLPGVGTHAMVDPPRTDMDEALGIRDNGELYALSSQPQILDRSPVPAPAALARALGVAPGTTVLRLEYVACNDGRPIVIATNYVVYPEAQRLLATPFRGHWYELMADAHVELGESEFVIDCVACDDVSAELLGIAPGAALLSVEQTITDPSGRVIDVAYLRIRPDGARFVARGTRLF